MTATRLSRIAGVVATLALCAATPAVIQAHHGWGGYASQEFELTGTLEQPLALAGPHATMKLRVNQQLWDLTLAPPLRVTQAGLTEKTIPVGATITIHGHRITDQRRFEVKTERVIYKGKTYNVYPDRD